MGMAAFAKGKRTPEHITYMRSSLLFWDVFYACVYKP